MQQLLFNFTQKKIIHQRNRFINIEIGNYVLHFFFQATFFFSQIFFGSPQTSTIDHNANLHSGNEVKSHHGSSNTLQ